jgi:hypothetical protein
LGPISHAASDGTEIFVVEPSGSLGSLVTAVDFASGTASREGTVLFARAVAADSSYFYFSQLATPTRIGWLPHVPGLSSGNLSIPALGAATELSPFSCGLAYSGPDLELVRLGWSYSVSLVPASLVGTPGNLVADAHAIYFADPANGAIGRVRVQ